MKRTIIYVTFFLMALLIAILAIMLFSSQNVVKQQKLAIAQQEQKITQLEAEVEKLSAVTPENILRMTSKFAKEKGAGILKDLISPK
jgi:cell division protein FtsL